MLPSGCRDSILVTTTLPAGRRVGRRRGIRGRGRGRRDLPRPGRGARRRAHADTCPERPHEVDPAGGARALPLARRPRAAGHDRLDRGHDTAPGFLFTTPSYDFKSDGPAIYDDRGSPVWLHPLSGTTSAEDFRVSLFQGTPVLTWWEGTVTVGLGTGQYVMADETYREIGRFGAANGAAGDLHEFLITPQGTALITAGREVSAAVAGHGHAVRRRRPHDRHDGLGGHRPGDRHPDAEGHLRVAQHGPRRPRRVVRAVAHDPQHAVRLPPPELDRRRCGRQPAALGPAHVLRLQGRPRHRRHHLAPGRQEERLRHGPGHGLRLAARRPPPGRRHDHPVRRQPGPQRVPRPRPGGGRDGQGGQPHPRLHPPELRSRRRARATCRSCPTAMPSSAGAASPTSRSSTSRARSSSTPPCRRAARPTAPSASRGWAAHPSYRPSPWT